MTLQDKETLRQIARDRRAALSPPQRAEAAEKFRQNFIDHVTLPPACVVAAYMPWGDELDVMPLLVQLSQAGHAVAMPVVHGKGAPLTFHRWSPGAPMVENAYGILQPGPDAEEVMPDIFIVPLLAFDRSGRRLGYGAGYYDLTFAAQRAAGRKFTAIGAAFAQQAFDVVPAGGHDVAMDLIVTDADVHQTRNGTGF